MHAWKMIANAGLDELVFSVDGISLRVKKEMEVPSYSHVPIFLVHYELMFPNKKRITSCARYDWGKYHFIDYFVDDFSAGRDGYTDEFQKYVSSDSEWKGKWEEYKEKINDWFTCSLQNNVVKIRYGEKVYSPHTWRKFLLKERMKGA